MGAVREDEAQMIRRRFVWGGVNGAGVREEE
jgi:hypothetical protein